MKKIILFIAVALIVSKAQVNVQAATTGGRDTLPIGSLEQVDDQVISGWASDPDFVGPITVDIYVDDQFIRQVTASDSHGSQGAHGFHFNHSPYGSGNYDGHGGHKVEVYANGVDQNGTPNNHHVALSHSPQTLVGNCDLFPTYDSDWGWCKSVTNYWLTRQHDTHLLSNQYVTIGINNSYGGMLNELYSDDTSTNLVVEHMGADFQYAGFISDDQYNGAQTGDWGYFKDLMDANIPISYMSDPRVCQRFDTREACNAAAPTDVQCNMFNPYAFSHGQQVANCRDFLPCYGAAAFPWNPTQGHGNKCDWGDSPNDTSNDVDIAEPTSTGGWHIVKNNIQDFNKTRTNGQVVLPGVNLDQTVDLGDVYAKIHYILSYTGQRPTSIGPEAFGMFMRPGMAHHMYYYNGNRPYNDPTNATMVTADSIRPSDPNGSSGKTFTFPDDDGHQKPWQDRTQATERWFTSCNAAETHCVTFAIFDRTMDGSIAISGGANNAYTQYAGTINMMGYFPLTPGMRRDMTLYVFPYKWDKVINGRTIRQRIYDLHNGGPTPTPIRPTNTPVPPQHATPTPQALTCTLTASPSSVSQDATSVTITATNVPSTVTQVRLPTWSDINGQDDIQWYSANNQGGGRWTLTVNPQNHPVTANAGHVSVHGYLFDAAHPQGVFCNASGFTRTIGPTSTPIPNTPIPTPTTAQIGGVQVSGLVLHITPPFPNICPTSGYAGLNGINVYLQGNGRNDSTQSATGGSQQAGAFYFQHVMPGTYSVCAVPSAGYDNFCTFPVTTNEGCTTINVGTNNYGGIRLDLFQH